MTFASLATITCVCDGKKRDLQLIIRWTDADCFDSRMFNIRSSQKVINALGNKIGRPISQVLFVNYFEENSSPRLPDITLSLSGL